MDEADLARFIEDVLITLAGARDRHGLKIMLPVDHQIVILAGAITALNSTRYTAALFRPVDLGPGGEIQFGD